MSDPAPALEYTPVRPRSGGLVHATSMTDPLKTACGRRCTGWQVALQHLGCRRCKAKIYYPVKLPVVEEDL